MLRLSSAPVVCLAILLLLALSAIQHHKSYTADEIYELCNLNTNWATVSESPDGFPPLYRWLLSVFVKIVGSSNARLFSALTATIGLVFVAAAGHRLGPRVGSLAALFYAVSACQLEYAQQVRAYSLYICLGAVSLWAAIKVIDQRRFRDWVVLVLSSIGVLWTHYYASLFLVCVWLGVLVLAYWDKAPSSAAFRRFLGSYAIAALACFALLIPWIQPLRIDLNNPPPVEAVNAVDMTGIAYTYLTLVQGWCIGPSQLELFEWPKSRAIAAVAPWALLSAAFFALVVYNACIGKGHQSQAKVNTNQQVVSIWLVATIVCLPLGAAVVAWGFGSSYVPRYLAVLTVPLSLVFGVGARLDKFTWLGMASWGLILINLISCFGRNFSDRYDRENYRALMQFLREQDRVPHLLVLSHYLAQAIEYQQEGPAVLQAVGFNSDEPDDWPAIEEKLPKLFGDSNRYWIVADWMRADDPRLAKRDQILEKLKAQHVRRIAGTLDLFEVAAGAHW